MNIKRSEQNLPSQFQDINKSKPLKPSPLQYTHSHGQTLTWVEAINKLSLLSFTNPSLDVSCCLLYASLPCPTRASVALASHHQVTTHSNCLPPAVRVPLWAAESSSLSLSTPTPKICFQPSLSPLNKNTSPIVHVPQMSQFQSQPGHPREGYSGVMEAFQIMFPDLVFFGGSSSPQLTIYSQSVFCWFLSRSCTPRATFLPTMVGISLATALTRTAIARGAFCPHSSRSETKLQFSVDSTVQSLASLLGQFTSLA